VSFAVPYRKNPFAAYAVAAGLEPAIDLLEHWRFEEEDLAFLAVQRGADGEPLFEREFLDFLGRLRMDLDVDAMPEGTVAFPHEPVVRVSGPMVPAMIVESALLAVVNFQTLVATKAARVCFRARRASQ
jgi:nicotinate phosphoribosyltransferase